MAANPKKLALGRGLNALLSPEDQEVLQQAVREGFIPLDQIKVNPFQPRDQFDQQAMDELKQSIEQLGIIQPLTVRRVGLGSYQLISGERRLRAARLLKMTEVPAYVVDTGQQGMIEMALVENLQRKDLNPIEIGLALARLQEECNLNQDQIGQRVGMSRPNVSHYMRMVKLPPDIQWSIRSGDLEMGHAKVLAGVTPIDVQLDLAKRCLAGKWSVRTLEAAAKALMAPRTPSPSSPAGKMPAATGPYLQVQTRLSRHFESPTRVQVQGNGKGEIRIPFTDTDDLNRLLDLIFDGTL
ncbi:MAG: ParB/RepB/Spo0J family partition protein [Bacteroidetes bacterium]|nr:ParB/RepB/Spo0J family partition protein [Bacteroidota bacterium]